MSLGLEYPKDVSLYTSEKGYFTFEGSLNLANLIS